MSILVEEAQIAKILESAKTIAVVGLSSKPWRPSFGVSAYMQKQGYHIIPVNPNVAWVGSPVTGLAIPPRMA